MGQKIHPVGFRLPVTRNWASRWYANNQNFASMLAEDLQVREYLKGKLKNAAVSRILIERPAKNARITIFSARPGVVIGKKGEDIEALRKEVSAMMGVPVHINIEEIRKPELDAQLIAEGVAQVLVGRGRELGVLLGPRVIEAVAAADQVRERGVLHAVSRRWWPAGVLAPLAFSVAYLFLQTGSAGPQAPTAPAPMATQRTMALPDFSQIAAEQGPAVVNISVTGHAPRHAPRRGGLSIRAAEVFTWRLVRLLCVRGSLHARAQ